MIVPVWSPHGRLFDRFVVQTRLASPREDSVGFFSEAVPWSQANEWVTCRIVENAPGIPTISTAGADGFLLLLIGFYPHRCLRWTPIPSSSAGLILRSVHPLRWLARRDRSSLRTVSIEPGCNGCRNVPDHPMVNMRVRAYELSSSESRAAGSSGPSSVLRRKIKERAIQQQRRAMLPSAANMLSFDPETADSSLAASA